MLNDRSSEWFVPKIGSKKFQNYIGMLFLPYTGMVLSFTIWGSVSDSFSYERIIAICAVYFLALGVGAHGLDSIGSKTKPWSQISKKNIKIISIVSLIGALVIGYYYAFLDAWLLFPISILEIFFLVSYNLELFKARFHNNFIFVISWGVLPVFAGTIIQTNSINFETIIFACIAAVASYVLIKTSRRYKWLKRHEIFNQEVIKKENLLKILSISVMISAICLLLFRHL